MLVGRVARRRELDLDDAPETPGLEPHAVGVRRSRHRGRFHQGVAGPVTCHTDDETGKR